MNTKAVKLAACLLFAAVTLTGCAKITAAKTTANTASEKEVTAAQTTAAETYAETTAQKTAAAAETTETKNLQNKFTITENTVRDEKLGENGQDQGYIKYILPLMTADDETYAAGAAAFNARMSAFSEEKYTEFTASRNEISGTGQEMPYCFEDTSYTLEYCGNYVSIKILMNADLGGVHGSYYYYSYIFDMGKSQFVNILDLANDQEGFKTAVAEEILRQINEKGLAEGYNPDYETTARAWNEYCVSLGENGLTVTFPPYEIACYAAGQQVFVIDSSIVKSYLAS